MRAPPILETLKCVLCMSFRDGFSWKMTSGVETSMSVSMRQGILAIIDQLPNSVKVELLGVGSMEALDSVVSGYGL